jgi:glyoxylase-like metal-dependent hydrolase (beta-lactamase superfamily II)
MKATQHGENLHKLTRYGAVNAYLVREDDGFTLIDTTTKGAEGAIIEAAHAAGAPIVRIVATHSHADHIGSLDGLASTLPEAEIIFSSREARLMEKREVESGEPDSKLRGSYIQSETKPGTLVEPGDAIGSLQVVAAPGHTPGQIALLDGRDGTLIAGDAYSTLGGVATPAKTNWRFPLVAMATWDGPRALATARELAALKPARLATGHGRVIESPGAAMAAAIDKAS